MKNITNIVRKLTWYFMILLAAMGALFLVAIVIGVMVFSVVVYKVTQCPIESIYPTKESFLEQVALMEQNDLELQTMIIEDVKGWEMRNFFSRGERGGGLFGTTALFATTWYYDSKDGGMWAPCIYVDKCGKITLNRDAGECHFMEKKMETVQE